MKAVLIYAPNSASNQSLLYNYDSSSININSNNNNMESKIKHVEAHPTLPWVAGIEENDRIIVLDFIRNEILAYFSMDDLRQWTANESMSANTINATMSSSSYRYSTFRHRRKPRRKNSNINIGSANHGTMGRFGSHPDNATTTTETTLGNSTMSSVGSLGTNTTESINSNSTMDADVNGVNSVGGGGGGGSLKVNTNINLTHSPSPPSLSRLTPISMASQSTPHNQPTNTNNTNGNNSHHKQNYKLGSIRQVKFFDRHTIYWETHLYQSNHTNTTKYQQQQQQNQYQEHPYNYSQIPHNLIVYCDYRTIIIPLAKSSSSLSWKCYHLRANLNNNNNSSSAGINKSNYQPIQSVMAKDYQRYPPTCMAAAITPTILMVGSYSGTIFWYDLEQDRMIKIVRIHNKPDSITQLIITKNGNHSSAAGIGNGTLNMNIRFVALCSSGIAYLLETALTFNHDSGYYEITPKPTLGRIEGLLNASDANSAITANTNYNAYFSSGGTSTNSSSVLGGKGSSSNSTGCLSYDADRDFLVGILTGGKMSGVWDLSMVSSSITSQVLKPFLILKMSGYESLLNASGSNSTHGFIGGVSASVVGGATGVVSGSGGSVTSANSSGSSSSSIMVIPSMQHPAFPDTLLTCWMANTNKAEISVLVSTLGSRNTMIMQPEVHFSVSLNSFKEYLPHKIKIYSMAIPRFRNHNVICGTSAGIVVLSIEDDAASKVLCGARHALLNEDSQTGGVLLIEGSSLFATSLDSSIPNPTGPLSLRRQNPVLVYKSPDLFSHSSKSINQIRLPPRLLLSPSQEYLCLFWHSESIYEILHVPSLYKSKKGSGHYPPPVEIGLDVVSFAWIGKEDAFAILHSTVSSETNLSSSSTMSLSSGGGGGTSGGNGGSTVGGVVGGVVKSGFSLKKELKSVIKRKNIIDVIPSATRRSNTSSTDSIPSALSSYHAREESKRGTVELKILIGINMDETENVGSIAAATATSLGEISIRGGGKPQALFGGPVLCIGSIQSINRLNKDVEKEAYFYSTSRTNDSNVKASSFTSVGPSLPFPDLVVWSDDGKFCCLCVASRISIYFSNAPEFTLIGTTLLAPNEVDPKIESAKFIHNVLYFTSRKSVQCVFFGPVSSSNDKVRDMDSFVLASSDTPLFSMHEISAASTSFTPQPYPIVFSGGPSILSYFSGSLLVSTPSGIKGINLSHPLLRIGILIAAGHMTRAQRWFEAIDPQYHESLARFLERRRVPELAAGLPGLSLESIIDLCIKYALTSTLENLIEEHGVSSIRQIDIIKGGFHGAHSTVECVGAFLLSQGKAELVRRMASECIVSGEEARKEAFFLASLLLTVDVGDAKRLVKRAVGNVRGKNVGNNDVSFSWPVGKYVRNHVL